ncbi:hypothetical protein ACQJBY_036349 [Aegilops geniculata]
MQVLLQLRRKHWKGIASTMVATAHSDKSKDYTIPEGAHQAAPQPAGVPLTTAGWQGNSQAAGPYGPPGVAAQNQNTNGQVPNWTGNSGYPPAPGQYPGHMYSAPPQQYTVTSGGLSAPPPPPPHEMHPSHQMPPAHHGNEMHLSHQMPPAHHGNQQRPASGAPGTGQPPPYYHH